MPDFAKMRVKMVDTQVRPSDVTRYPVIAAMLDVPRELFVPPALRSVAYVDENIPLEPGRVVLGPRTLGKMLDALAIERGAKVLVVASGAGYTAAVLTRMGASVTALDDCAALSNSAAAAMVEAGFGGAETVIGPLGEGWPAGAPYDAILVDSGGVEQIPPALGEQLCEGGRIVATFIEGSLGTIRLGLGTANGPVWSDLFHAHAPILPGFARERVFAL